MAISAPEAKAKATKIVRNQTTRNRITRYQITRNQILKPLVWIACLLPLAWLVYGGFTAGLGANPIERITHRTGLTTLVLLLAGLAITPLRRWIGLLWLIQYRRLVGLFAFF